MQLFLKIGFTLEIGGIFKTFLTVQAGRRGKNER